jgi:hypothetical protein
LVDSAPLSIEALRQRRLLRPANTNIAPINADSITMTLPSSAA